MQWEILSERVRKSLSVDIPKNLVFHVHSRIKSINVFPCHLIWPFFSDMIAFKTQMKDDVMQYELSY